MADNMDGGGPPSKRPKLSSPSLSNSESSGRFHFLSHLTCSPQKKFTECMVFLRLNLSLAFHTLVKALVVKSADLDVFFFFPNSLIICHLVHLIACQWGHHLVHVLSYSTVFWNVQRCYWLLHHWKHGASFIVPWIWLIAKYPGTVDGTSAFTGLVCWTLWVLLDTSRVHCLLWMKSHQGIWLFAVIFTPHGAFDMWHSWLWP